MSTLKVSDFSGSLDRASFHADNVVRLSVIQLFSSYRVLFITKNVKGAVKNQILRNKQTKIFSLNLVEMIENPTSEKQERPQMRKDSEMGS